MSALVVAITLAVPVLHSGERQWFMPGVLQAGSKVVCVGNGTRLVVAVPSAPSGNDAWNAGLQASVSARDDGAVEFDCGVAGAPPRIVPARYRVGRNGLGLLRGPSTRARLERLYGIGVAQRACTDLRWPAIGLRATFAGCTARSPLAEATVTGSRWATLDGVQAGDSVARMLWQDAGARRVHGEWILGGVGLQRPPRLIALVGPTGTVTGFRVVSR